MKYLQDFHPPPSFEKKPHLYGIKYFHWYLKPLSHPMLHTVLFSLFLYFLVSEIFVFKVARRPGLSDLLIR